MPAEHLRRDGHFYLVWNQMNPVYFEAYWLSPSGDLIKAEQAEVTSLSDQLEFLDRAECQRRFGTDFGMHYNAYVVRELQL